MEYYCIHGFIRDSEKIDYSGRCETCTTLKIESLETQLKEAVHCIDVLLFCDPVISPYTKKKYKKLLQTLKGE